MHNNFVHLHTHSEFSLLDGALRLKDLISQAKEFNMPAVALTDHGVMYGIIDFYQKAIAQKIKPLIGCEVYVAPRSRFEKTRKDESQHHLTLLAQNNQGYRNLMHLVSLGFLEGFYYRPRVDHEILRQYHEGIIALSGCMTGEIPKLILSGQWKEAKERAEELRTIFGKENFFLEIQNQGLEGQDKLLERLGELGKELKIPLVATNDVHYLRQENSTAQDVLLCIQTGSTLEAEDRLKFKSDQFYLKSPEEMASLFSAFPEAIQNTLEIAGRCNVKIDLGQVYLPHYDVPEGYNLHSYLEKLCREGIAKRYPEITPTVKDRLEHELAVIKDTGFSGYFLVVWDFINFAKKQGIKVGPGRGSAAGSIVAYALGITNIDPLKYDLLFERFLNPERISMPDIDIDFCYERRDEVIRYVTEKYGKERVAQIITFSTMAARAATRDAGRVFGIPYGRVDRIAKLIPETPGMTLDEALRVVPELRLEYETDEVTKKILDAARALEGLARQDSIHAAGVVISQEELPNHVPIQRKPNTEVVTQYPMEAIKEIGLLKIDFLGLRTLTVIDNAIQIIKRTRGVEIDIERIPFDDKTTYQMLKKGESIGLFQLESSGMRALIRELKPTSFADIVALLALYRPGPLQSNMVKDFIDCKHGLKPIVYSHPLLKPILEETYGIILYQEQVMRIATDLAGFTLAEADILRGAMSKKKPEVLAKQREKFVEGAAAKGIEEKTATKIFDLMAHFAGYGFNRSHSTAYAVISYQTAYLKANYTKEFMAALLTSIMDNKDKVAQYVNECRQLGIEILPPDVNESFKGFTVTGERIRFGLWAIRNVGEGAIKAIIKTRKEKGPFKSIFDFCQRVDINTLNKRVLESLIKAGAFDSCGQSRKYLLSLYEQAIDVGLKRKRDQELGQFSLFGTADTEVTQETTKSREELSKQELLSFEKEMLGLYVSDNPLLEVAPLLKTKTSFPLSQLKEQQDGSSAWVGGIISKINQITTRKGEPMLFIRIEDLEGSVEVVIFPSVYQKYQSLLLEDRLVRVKGRIDLKEDEVKVIAQEIEVLNGKEPPKHALYLKIPTQKLNGNLVKELKSILKSHPGEAQVYLQLKEGKKITTLRFSEEFLVNPESLSLELRELLGEDAISLV